MARAITTQDVSWFLDLQERGRLDLSPPYQRRSVWTSKERRFFLDTIFNGYPCPPVFLYKSLSNEGIATYHVVDGKQRLETMINYANNRIALPSDIGDQMLAGKKWRQLDIDQKKRFWNYQFAVEMLDVIDDIKVKEIFDRYNRTSKNLQRQELRHARFDGWFITAAEEEARKDEWRRIGIVTTGQARRMKDVQFISELMIVLISGEFFGFDQDQLDNFYANYDAPQDSDPDFAEEDFISILERTKAYILAMEATNNVVSEHGKSYTHFYTLWSVVALNYDRLMPANEAAKIYLQFMNRVALIRNSDTPEQLLEQQTEVDFTGPYTYAQNARGASTEPPQRTHRYNELLKVLTNEQPVNLAIEREVSQ